jgi:hypothetical protein
LETVATETPTSRAMVVIVAARGLAAGSELVKEALTLVDENFR